ncbi:MAG TPA: hypothetical protein PKD90_01665 [Phnomibacter sp.]|nr:hypothetical protein [Phnomibacter sp.]
MQVLQEGSCWELFMEAAGQISVAPGFNLQLQSSRQSSIPAGGQAQPNVRGVWRHV